MNQQKKAGEDKKRGCILLAWEKLQPLRERESVESEGPIWPWKWRASTSQSQLPTNPRF
jgi:hypothetical protein